MHVSAEVLAQIEELSRELRCLLEPEGEILWADARAVAVQEMTAFDVLDQLKADPRTRNIPVIIVTSHALPLEDRTRLGKQTDAILSKEHLSRELAINRIRDALNNAGIKQRSPRKDS